jgi:ferredoxin
VGKLIAGKDGIAVDAVCARLIGFESPRGIKLIDLAEKKGLVNFDLNHPQVDGPFEVIGDFAHPSTYTANIPGKKSALAANSEKFYQVWTELGRVNPACKEALCTQCGDCLSACPSGAMLMQPYPKVDPKKCASCFCCVEACPEKALMIPMADELLEKRSRVGM